MNDDKVGIDPPAGDVHRNSLTSVPTTVRHSFSSNPLMDDIELGMMALGIQDDLDDSGDSHVDIWHPRYGLLREGIEIKDYYDFDSQSDVRSQSDRYSQNEAYPLSTELFSSYESDSPAERSPTSGQAVIWSRKSQHHDHDPDGATLFCRKRVKFAKCLPKYGKKKINPYYDEEVNDRSRRRSKKKKKNMNINITYIPHLSLGDTSCPEDMLEKSTESDMDSLKTHDFAFVKRCCGHYTYAIIAYKSEDEILFVLDTNGSTKTLNRRHWSRCVRLVDTNHVHSYATTSYDRSSSSPHSSDTCKVKRAHDTPKPPPFATEKAIVWLFLGTLGELQFLLFQ